MDGLTLFAPQRFAAEEVEEAYPTFSVAGKPLWAPPLRVSLSSPSSPLRQRLLAWLVFVLLPTGLPDVVAAADDAAAAVAAAAAKQRGNLVAIVSHSRDPLYGRVGRQQAEENERA